MLKAIPLPILFLNIPSFMIDNNFDDIMRPRQ